MSNICLAINRQMAGPKIKSTNIDLFSYLQIDGGVWIK